MNVPDTPAPSPWHAGELAVQARVGVVERMDAVGRRVVRKFMPDQHRTFFAQLPFMVVGSVDHDGWPWASILTGPPGFVTSPDPTTLRVAARPAPDDPLSAVLALGCPIAFLGIELPTRRRNRMNGHVVAMDAAGFCVSVEQSFGNCAQYIQVRDYPAGMALPQLRARAERFSELGARARDVIARCDTSFVASCAPRDGKTDQWSVDVSHRGGGPGFMRFAPDGAIVIPDYHGNSFFNTLGNLSLNSRCGLLFIDFSTGDLLLLVGTAEIVWEGDAIGELPGAERLWRVKPIHGMWVPRVLPAGFRRREAPAHAINNGEQAGTAAPRQVQAPARLLEEPRTH